MLSRSLTNYRDLYFEHKSLTRISGKSTFVTLHQLLLELKPNAVLVPSTLGGGEYGFIGIILSRTTYTTLTPMTPLVVPTHPGTLRAPMGAT